MKNMLSLFRWSSRKLPLLFLLITMVLAGCQDDDETDPLANAAQQMQGVWTSVDSEPSPTGAYNFRQITFRESDWEIFYTTYADEARTIPLFQLHYSGPYRLTGISESIPGGYEGDFVFAQKRIILLTDDTTTINALGLESCGLTMGVGKDVSETGCSFVTSVAECSQDYDVLVVNGNTLTSGQRPDDNDMCSPDRRPQTLGFTLEKFD